MAGEMQTGVKKRKAGNESSKFKKFRKGKKIRREVSGDVRVKKMDRKMKKFFQKKARDYNSDDDEGDEEKEKVQGEREGLVVVKDKLKGGLELDFSEDEQDGEDDKGEQNEVSEDEDSEIQPGILRFSEGCKAFRLAFRKILKKTASTDDDVLGPVLSAHKTLVAEKLAEEEAERKVKSEAKKEKHLVNKAQHAQKGLNPSRSKDEKVIKKRRKETFFSVLGQAPSKQAATLSKVDSSAGTDSTDAPGWAPLRDNYMLTKSKLKDWDKMQDTTATDDFGLPQGVDSSSDDD